MGEDARLVWALDDPREIERWDKGIVLLEAYPLFRGAKRGRSIKQKWRLVDDVRTFLFSDDSDR
jgi:hypothetical protein